jgi:hypothetical protein
VQEIHDEIVAAAGRVPVDADDPRLLLILANAASVEEVARLVAHLSRLLPDRAQPLAGTPSLAA